LARAQVDASDEGSELQPFLIRIGSRANIGVTKPFACLDVLNGDREAVHELRRADSSVRRIRIPEIRASNDRNENGRKDDARGTHFYAFSGARRSFVPRSRRTRSRNTIT